MLSSWTVSFVTPLLSLTIQPYAISSMRTLTMVWKSALNTATPRKRKHWKRGSMQSTILMKPILARTNATGNSLKRPSTNARPNVMPLITITPSVTCLVDITQIPPLPLLLPPHPPLPSFLYPFYLILNEPCSMSTMGVQNAINSMQKKKFTKMDLVIQLKPS